MFTNKIHAGGSKEISARHSSVILVIRGNYSKSEKHRHVCVQFFCAHANSTDFSQVSWAKLGLSRYLDQTFGLDFRSAKSLHFLA